MRRLKSHIFALFLLVPLTAAASAQTINGCPTPARDPVSKAASDLIRGLQTGNHSEVVTAFYTPCDYALTWTKDGLLTPQAKALLAQFGNAELKGLRPTDYGVPGWRSRACALPVTCKDSDIELARFDVDLTAAVIRYVSDLTYGRAAPQNVQAGYTTHQDLMPVAELVRRDLLNSQDVAATIQSFEPQAPGYLRTEHALANLLASTRGDPDVVIDPHEKTLQPGDTSSSVPLLIRRLQQLGDLPDPGVSNATLTYGEPAVAAVKAFQSTHGISPTGTVDSKTWRALAVPLKQRAAQLALTLERWRWVPHAFTEPPIVINIPEYRVRGYDEELHVVVSMPVIVGGSAGRRSPVLQATMTEVIFHPYWNVPKKIQFHEIVPHLKRNPAYLSSDGFELVDSRGTVLHLSGASALHAVSSGSVRVRQVPGDKNALGAMKFVFPNAFDVYMHGTPEQKLFKKDRRDFSHGCIRVEDPEALALWVLRHESGWTAEQIHAAVAQPKTVTVRLSRPIPVLIVYGTGIAAEDGSLRFFDDVYGYDAALTATLEGLSETRRIADQAAWQ